MFSRIAVMAADQRSVKPQDATASSGLGPIVMFAALSPLCAVCGLMLTQILGFVPY